MALKRILENLDGLTAEVAAEYTQGADGKFVLNVDGLEDTGALKRALDAERAKNKTLPAAEQRAKEAEDRAKQYEGLGMTPEELKALADRTKNDEEAQEIAKGNITKVIDKRTAAMKTQYEKDLDAERQKTKQEQERRAKYTGKVLDNAIRAATTTVKGFHAFATDDALMRAKTIFQVNDDGEAVALNTDGSTVIGKDGTNPLSPKEWLESMREKCPHWFEAIQGGTGAPQGNQGAPGAKTIKRAELMKLTPMEQREKVQKQGFKVVD